MKILDRIAQCDDGRHRAAGLAERMRLAIHRTEAGTDAASIARTYREHPQARAVTAGQMPYTFVVTRGARVEQALPLHEHGPHARAWSDSSIGIGCIGDFRTEAIGMDQFNALVRLCAHLCRWLGAVEVFGHDEMPGASRDAGKECPGRYINMASLREQIRGEMRHKAERNLRDMGVVV